MPKLRCARRWNICSLSEFNIITIVLRYMQLRTVAVIWRKRKNKKKPSFAPRPYVGALEFCRRNEVPHPWTGLLGVSPVFSSFGYPAKLITYIRTVPWGPAMKQSTLRASSTHSAFSPFICIFPVRGSYYSNELCSYAEREAAVYNL